MILAFISIRSSDARSGAVVYLMVLETPKFRGFCENDQKIVVRKCHNLIFNNSVRSSTAHSRAAYLMVHEVPKFHGFCKNNQTFRLCTFGYDRKEQKKILRPKFQGFFKLIASFGLDVLKKPFIIFFPFSDSEKCQKYLYLFLFTPACACRH